MQDAACTPNRLSGAQVGMKRSVVNLVTRIRSSGLLLAIDQDQVVVGCLGEAVQVAGAVRARGLALGSAPLQPGMPSINTVRTFVNIHPRHGGRRTGLADDTRPDWQPPGRRSP